MQLCLKDHETSLTCKNKSEIRIEFQLVVINHLQASRSRRGYSSQLSLTSTGTVPDLTDRVIRVSFAPEVATNLEEWAIQISTFQGLASTPDSPKTPSTPGTPSPPDYDALSIHSRYKLFRFWDAVVHFPLSVTSNQDNDSFFFRVSASDPPPDYAVVVPE